MSIIFTHWLSSVTIFFGAGLIFCIFFHIFPNCLKGCLREREREREREGLFTTPPGNYPENRLTAGDFLWEARRFWKRLLPLRHRVTMTGRSFTHLSVSAASQLPQKVQYVELQVAEQNVCTFTWVVTASLSYCRGWNRLPSAVLPTLKWLEAASSHAAVWQDLKYQQHVFQTENIKSLVCPCVF